MAGFKAAEKLPVGSNEWLAEERASALKIAEEESEDFAFCARNEAEWLNEHVADIFSENHLSVKDIFKTPGKLRGKTPRTARKRNPLETRAPLTDIFSTTPLVQPSQLHIHHDRLKTPKFLVAKDVEPSEDAQKPKPKPVGTANKAFYDSGYHGSQSHADEEQMEIDETVLLPESPQQPSPPKTQVTQATEVSDVMEVDSELEEDRPAEAPYQSANEEPALPEEDEDEEEDEEEAETIQAEEPIKSPSPAQVADDVPEQFSPKPGNVTPQSSPRKRSPEKSAVPTELAQPETQEDHVISREERPVSREADVTFDDVQSPSDGSSPIRPIVRKSSLSFASLPAREPITTKQSIGNRISRTSHLDQTRTSYFGRPTGGKSLGNGPQISAQQEVKHDDVDRMEIDTDVAAQKPELPREESDDESNILQIHNKTSTQRLQDQISKLGQSQSNAHRPSTSIQNLSTATQPQSTNPSSIQQAHEELPFARKARPTVLPGTFPEDEDDSWIGPPHSSMGDTSTPNARPGLMKSFSTDVMEGVHGKIIDGRSEFMVPKSKGNETEHNSPVREPMVHERTTSTFSHAKAASTSQIKSPKKDAEQIAVSPYKQGISISNPSLASGQDNVDQSIAQPPSPTRSYRDSPLKASKDKLSSILKFSKGLFASGAALSAEAKSSGITPASKRFANPPSIPHQSEQLLTQTATDQNLYPTLETVADDPPPPASPSKPETGRRTRASTEREEKRKEKEAKEAQRMVAQLDKLEKAREKEKQKARVFSQEQEKAAAADKQVAAQNEQDKPAKASQVEVTRVTRTSPRKTKAQLEAEGRAAAALPTSEIDDDMGEGPLSMPPPSIPRPTMASQIGKPNLLKRPGRPLKGPASKALQAPMVIRVDTGSQRNQNHPSNSVLAASLQASLAPSATSSSQTGLKSKASTPAISTKASTNSFSSSMSSTGAPRPRALESAARKREQDEREAQRKREIKLENERKLDEKRQEQQRKKENERLREREREQLEAKKSSQAARQVLLKRKEVEMAKQQRPPPPPARHQPMDDNLRPIAQDKPVASVPQRMNQAAPRPASRMDNGRSQEDLSRPMNTGFHNTTKAPPKRPFQQDAGEEPASRPTIQRSGPSYQQNEAKRRKTDEEYQDTDVTGTQSRQMAPPIRQSNIRQKDGPSKALFSNGYSNAQQGSHGPSLHKATLQHLHQSKPAHPMDMAQVSKANISFAASGNQPAAGSSYKTPARPAHAAGKSAAKSHAKSSPRYQNGEEINLPEIHTDSEDEDEDGENDFAVPDWADSPALRDQLAAQDSIDPSEVFGPMPELKMEEIFKNKERWNRFRARTSSANWSGSDRLTEDEIQKDLEGRERLRREGGWTYGLS